MERALYSPKEVAELLGVTEVSLYRWRAAGDGPPYLQLSAHGPVRYECDALRAWMARRTQRAG
jgi:predicted DNA-binding transcriptional regulator AlpA